MITLKECKNLGKKLKNYYVNWTGKILKKKKIKSVRKEVYLFWILICKY